MVCKSERTWNEESGKTPKKHRQAVHRLLQTVTQYRRCHWIKAITTGKTQAQLGSSTTWSPASSTATRPLMQWAAPISNPFRVQGSPPTSSTTGRTTMSRQGGGESTDPTISSWRGRIMTPRHGGSVEVAAALPEGTAHRLARAGRLLESLFATIAMCRGPGPVLATAV